MSTPNLDYLREQVTALKALLDDPHPGLASWVGCYSQRMRAISNFWNGTPVRTASDFTHGMRVRYVPGHAHSDADHPDCEDGAVLSNNGKNVFVKFDKQVPKLGWLGATSQACSPEDLVPL